MLASEIQRSPVDMENLLFFHRVSCTYIARFAGFLPSTVTLEIYDFVGQKNGKMLGPRNQFQKELGSWWYEEHAYSPVNQHGNGKSPILIGDTSSKGPFSIAILVYWSVDLVCDIQHFSQPDQTFLFILQWGATSTQVDPCPPKKSIKC